MKNNKLPEQYNQVKKRCKYYKDGYANNKPVLGNSKMSVNPQKPREIHCKHPDNPPICIGTCKEGYGECIFKVISDEES